MPPTSNPKSYGLTSIKMIRISDILISSNRVLCWRNNVRWPVWRPTDDNIVWIVSPYGSDNFQMILLNFRPCNANWLIERLIYDMWIASISCWYVRKELYRSTRMVIIIRMFIVPIDNDVKTVFDRRFDDCFYFLKFGSHIEDDRPRILFQDSVKILRNRLPSLLWQCSHSNYTSV